MYNILRNNKVAKKVIFIIILSFIFIFCLFSKILANSYNDNEIINKIVNHLKSQNESGNVVCYSSKENSKYEVFCFDTTKVTASFNELNQLVLRTNGFTRLGIRYYSEEGEFISKDSSKTLSGTDYITFEKTSNLYYLYSDNPIYDSNGNIVNPYQPVLFQIQETGQIPEIMAKTIKMIIPTGLIVLSIGLLIYVVKSVILRAT